MKSNTNEAIQNENYKALKHNARHESIEQVKWINRNSTNVPVDYLLEEAQKIFEYLIKDLIN